MYFSLCRNPKKSLSAHQSVPSNKHQMLKAHHLFRVSTEMGGLRNIRFQVSTNRPWF